MHHTSRRFFDLCLCSLWLARLELELGTWGYNL
jgi:hypothetical protein